MTTDTLYRLQTSTPQDIRRALLIGSEIALIDVREEHEFAQGHPLFAAQIPLRRIDEEARWRIPRLDTPIEVYDNGEGLSRKAAVRLEALGYTDVRELEGGLTAWRDAGYELFEDVNSYSKAFGELVEHRRHTPSLPAEEVQALIREKADIRKTASVEGSLSCGSLAVQEGAKMNGRIETKNRPAAVNRTKAEVAA